MRRIVVLLAVLAASPAAAQVLSRPSDPPIVDAASELWYVRGEPIPFAGDLYYPAGPTVFFNGNHMVRTGHVHGVPLYADATLEPYSVVFVPIGGGLMQPYERVRRGELAGTTGSRPPSFPVRVVPDGPAAPPAAAAPPTLPPAPPDPGGADRPAAAAPDAPTAVGTSGMAPGAQMYAPRPVVTLRQPESNDGIWIAFAGERWVSAGPAVLLIAADFLRVGEYAGFPVFARRELQEEVIYLPMRAGLVAPYRLKR